MKAKRLFRQATMWGATMVMVPLTFLQSSRALAGSVSYGYDSLGRLTRASFTSGVVISYGYDAAGNRSSTTITGGAPELGPLSAPLVSSGPTVRGATATGRAATPSSGQPRLAPHLLPIMVEDPAVYGWNGYSEQPESVVTTIFDGDGTDLLLHLRGYAINTPEEVGLWLNGTLLGYLSAAADGALSAPSLWLLPAALQLPGENMVMLAPRTRNQVWGVTGLGLYPVDGGLISQVDKTGGSPGHADSFEIHLIGRQPIEVAGYLINLKGDASSDQGLTIELNNALLAELPQGDQRSQEPAYQVWIDPELLLAGDNLLLIINRYGPPQSWGVRIDPVLPGNDGRR